MATDTFASRGINQVIFTNKVSAYIVERTANGTDLKPGYCATTYLETYPDLDLTGGGENPLGIITNRIGHEIDTAYDDDDENVPVVHRFGSQGVGVWALLEATFTAKDVLMYYVKTTAGMFSNWGYVDGAPATDTLLYCMLGGGQYKAADATDNKLRKFFIR